jgi:dihydrofolate reductase
MRIEIIVAMSENRVIGYRKKMPWHLPADLKHFKDITMGKPILMGRTTYESIGKPLPGRCNIVITRDVEFRAPGCVLTNSIDCALEAASYSDKLLVIGGASLYEHMLPRSQRIYLTLIHADFPGDTHFPEIDKNEWVERERSTHAADGKNPFAFDFVTLDRK